MTTATIEVSQALVDQPIEAADTPALYVDLDAFDHNASLMAKRAAEQGVLWRPHVKASKSPDLAKLLLASGAKGITCAKVGEAEAMVAGGIDDILIANEIVGPQKIARLIAVAQQARLCVAVDDTRNIDELSQAASAAGLTLDVLVDINIGANRCGVTPEAAPALARAVLDVPGLNLRGLMGYEGHVMGIADPEEKEAKSAIAAEIFAAARSAVEAAGIVVDIMSGGGTGNYWFNIALGVANELQAGGGVLLDRTYQEKMRVPDHRQSLFIQAQIVSTTVPGRAVADAGWKTTGIHTGLPLCVAPEGVEVRGINAEHTILSLADGVIVAPGDRITMVPNYSDSTMLLHRTLYAVRTGIIEAAWPISAAGALQ
jgi:D-serine deaminase-like pyridoxal phosphate-dependent protein